MRAQANDLMSSLDRDIPYPYASLVDADGRLSPVAPHLPARDHAPHSINVERSKERVLQRGVLLRLAQVIVHRASSREDALRIHVRLSGSEGTRRLLS